MNGILNSKPPLKTAESEAEWSVMSPAKAPAQARAATLADIAKHVGVSRVAASVVLNNSRSQVRVSEATRQRLLDAARELNYQPNALARSLLRQRTNVIGFYSAHGQPFNPMFPFYGAILKGLIEGCEVQQKKLLVHGTFNNSSEEQIYLELLNGQIDGLVLYARKVTPLIERLIESRLPVVSVADEIPGLPFVTVDGEAGGRLMARHLAEKGYRRALYWVSDAVLPSSIQRRVDGFVSEARRHDLEVEVYHARGAWPFDDDVEAILERKQRPEVIAAFSDFEADNLITLARRRGLRVPEDIAITGFDGFVATRHLAERLTTIRAPWEAVAREAVSLLVAQCDGHAVRLRTKLPVEMVAGDTA